MSVGSPRLRLALVAVLAFWPSEAPAQSGQESGIVGMEQRRRAQVIRPLPSSGDVEQDANQAIEDLRAERRRDGLIRDSVPHIKPPYADADVRGGIQSQNIQKALPRR